MLFCFNRTQFFHCLLLFCFTNNFLISSVYISMASIAKVLSLSFKVKILSSRWLCVRFINGFYAASLLGTNTVASMTESYTHIRCGFPMTCNHYSLKLFVSFAPNRNSMSTVCDTHLRCLLCVSGSIWEENEKEKENNQNQNKYIQHLRLNGRFVRVYILMFTNKK